jgi:hypothetical protein
MTGAVYSSSTGCHLRKAHFAAGGTDISIPSSAQVPFNVAFEDVDGLLYNLDYTLTQNGPWVDVTFTTPSPGVQLEYYDPEFERDGDQRQYEYTWPGNFLSTGDVGFSSAAGECRQHDDQARISGAGGRGRMA